MSFEPWIPSLPKGWSTVPARAIFSPRHDRSTTGDEALLSVSEYSGVQPKSDVVGDGEFLTRAESLVGYRLCSPGDLVMNIMLAWKRGLGVTEHEGIVSPSYAVFKTLPGRHPRYFHYLLRTDLYSALFGKHSTGIISSRWRLYPETFLGLPIVLPPLARQIEIAAALDIVTGEADGLIEKYAWLVDLLQEKRSALITRAITHGITANPKMKASGVPSFAEIPAEWNIMPLQRLVAKFVDYRGSTPTKLTEGIRIVTAANVKMGFVDYDAIEVYMPESEYRTRMIRGLPELGDVLLTMEAPLGQCAQVDDANIALGQRVMLIKTDTTVLSPRYLKWYLLSGAGQRELLSLATGSTALGIKASKLVGIPILLPPLPEQERIADHIERELRLTDPLRATATEAIDLVKEYRSALIFDAVIGKNLKVTSERFREKVAV